MWSDTSTIRANTLTWIARLCQNIFLRRRLAEGIYLIRSRRVWVYATGTDTSRRQKSTYFKKYQRSCLTILMHISIYSHIQIIQWTRLFPDVFEKWTTAQYITSHGNLQCKYFKYDILALPTKRSSHVIYIDIYTMKLLQIVACR